jgi:hypothetical protein
MRWAEGLRLYELAVEEPVSRRVAVAFDELALAIGSREGRSFSMP